MKVRRRRLALNWPSGRRQVHFMRRSAHRALAAFLADKLDRDVYQKLTEARP